eukprot:TRINITY_DN43330_c0_g1_i1.p1 TRINITY_DN43330_c0_g1~~TRINITY_DN43330_c0_g1_i1.p1  ORF type:complete len:434 (+),score=30.48 TRINITY_DN43330_c0_g1_i1:87-1388(+)
MLDSNASACTGDQGAMCLSDGQAAAAEQSWQLWPGACFGEALLEVLSDASLGPARMLSSSVTQFVRELKAQENTLAQGKDDCMCYFPALGPWNAPSQGKEAPGGPGETEDSQQCRSSYGDSTSEDEQQLVSSWLDSATTLGAIGLWTALGSIVSNATTDTAQHVLTVYSSSVVCGSPHDMLRLFREEPRPRPHWFVRFMIGGAVTVYVVELCLHMTGMPWNQVMYVCGANAGAVFTHGQVYRILTGMFVQRRFVSLLSNSLMLLRISQLLHGRLARDGQEDASWLFLIVPGVFGNLVSSVVHPYAASVGLAGPIYGALGASFYMLVHRRLDDHGKVAVPVATLITLCANLLSPIGVDYIGRAASWLCGYCLMAGYLPDHPIRISPTLIRERATYPAYVAGFTSIALMMLVMEQSHWLPHSDYAPWPPSNEIPD